MDIDSMKIAVEVHSKTDEELVKNRIDIYDKLLALGADWEDLFQLSAIDTELGMRAFREGLINELGD